MKHTVLVIIILCTTTLTTAVEKAITINHDHRRINWRNVKMEGITFALAEATGGRSYSDDGLVNKLKDMKNNKLKIGVYHRLSGKDDPTAQAEFIKTILSTTIFDKQKDVLVIEVASPGNTNASPQTMSQTLMVLLLRLRSDFKNIYILTEPEYWEEKVAWRNYDFSDYNLWIADDSNNNEPKVPTTWKDKGYAWWQYCENCDVGGVKFCGVSKTRK